MQRSLSHGDATPKRPPVKRPAGWQKTQPASPPPIRDSIFSA
ncbi:MAG: hypothetical protein WB579_21890 [Bryobacteraceae bacterium]